MSVGKQTLSATLEGLCTSTLAESSPHRIGELLAGYDPEDLTDFDGPIRMVADFTVAKLTAIIKQLPGPEQLRVYWESLLLESEESLAQARTATAFEIEAHPHGANKVLESAISRATEARARIEQCVRQIQQLKHLDPTYPALAGLTEKYTMEEVEQAAEAIPINVPVSFRKAG